MIPLSDLTQQPFLRGVPEACLAPLADCARAVRLAAGEYLLRQGQPADRFYLLTEGEVTLTSFLPGQGALPVEVLGAGEALGWSWLLPPYQWHFDAQARTAVAAIRFDADCLRRHMEADHELGYRLQQRFLGVVLRRLQASRLQLLDVYDLPCGGRRWGP